MPEACVSSKPALVTEASLAADGLAHGVTTRALGSMKSAENRKKALEAAGIGGLPLYFCRQVHGINIVRIRSGSPADLVPEADGLMTDRRDVALGVYMADCMPLFVWRAGGPFGVFHSGWRGTAAGMPRAAVESLAKCYGVRPGDLKAHVGAHIGGCCYSVGDDVARKFDRDALTEREGKLFLDLSVAARSQFLAAGLRAENVTLSSECTSCLGGEYFSYRRDKAGDSLMAFAALGRPA